jgi:L-aminopeptidase/D-esterase-like protein
LGSNTTIGVIATDAPLNKAQCQRLAQVAHDGLARSIRPVHTPMDGDTLFALSTGNTGASNNSGLSADMMLLSTLAAEVTAMAVVNAIEAATSLRIGSTWWPAKNNR